MIEYAKVILWGVSFWKALFKKELEKIMEWSDSNEILELRNYCYEKYLDMHPDVLEEVFGTAGISFSESNKIPVTLPNSKQNAHNYVTE